MGESPQCHNPYPFWAILSYFKQREGGEVLLSWNFHALPCLILTQTGVTVCWRISGVSCIYAHIHVHIKGYDKNLEICVSEIHISN